MLQAAALLTALWGPWAVYSWLTNAVRAEEAISARLVIFCAMAEMVANFRSHASPKECAPDLTG